MERKLVSIQQIQHIEAIEGADRIVKATVLGWAVVVLKDEFQVGDTCIYMEVDSFLPVTDERFEFLRASSYRNNDYMGEGYRIRTVRLRKQISQGLLLKTELFPEVQGCVIGDDVTALLGVKKYEMPEQNTGFGIATGGFHPYAHKTDELRIQSEPRLLQILKGLPYYISTKMDGASTTISVDGDVVRVFNRNREILDDDSSIVWNFVHKHGIDLKMKALGGDFSIQGEFCGPCIRGNHLKLKEFQLYLYSVNDALGKRGTLDDLMDISKKLELEMVPIDEIGPSFNYTLEELIEMARGRYASGIHREGIVIRPLVPFESEGMHALSFKVINNDFLLKVED